MPDPDLLMLSMLGADAAAALLTVLWQFRCHWNYPLDTLALTEDEWKDEVVVNRVLTKLHVQYSHMSIPKLVAVTCSGREVEDPVIALPLLAATLHTLESEDFQETDLSPVNDLTQKVRPSDPDAPSDTVTEELASRGLGETGSVQIPQAIRD